jgi:hypothetical protein
MRIIQTLSAVLLLTAALVGQQLPDAPSATQKQKTCKAWCTFDPQTRKWDLPMRSNREVFTDWKWTASLTGFVLANVADIAFTKHGLGKGKCAEKNGDPYPSTGQLILKDAVPDAAVIGMSYLLKRSRIKFVPEGMLLYGVYVHARGAYDWSSDGCF